MRSRTSTAWLRPLRVLTQSFRKVMKMLQSQFIKLTNGLIFDASLIVCIVRKDSNDYAIVLKDCPAIPTANLYEVEQIWTVLTTNGATVKVLEAPKPTIIKTKLEKEG